MCTDWKILGYWNPRNRKPGLELEGSGWSDASISEIQGWTKTLPNGRGSAQISSFHEFTQHCFPILLWTENETSVSIGVLGSFCMQNWFHTRYCLQSYLLILLSKWRLTWILFYVIQDQWSVQYFCFLVWITLSIVIIVLSSTILHWFSP